MNAAREIALSISGGDVLAVFLLAPLALITFKALGYFVLCVVMSGAPPTWQELLLIIVVLTVLVGLAFGIWEFSHWIVQE